jgi:hypothetical protein
MHHWPLGSMSKNSCKMVANWLVRLLGSVPGSAVDRADVMLIDYSLKGN